MNISIPATEKLFEYYRHLQSFDFAKEFMNELETSQLKPGKHYEKEFWDEMVHKNSEVLSNWKEECDRVMLNDSIPYL